MKHREVVDYDKLLGKLSVPEGHAQFAYVTATSSSQPFANYLRSRGFIVRVKEIRANKPDSFDVDLTIDALAAADGRSLIICSNSLNLLPLIKNMTDAGTYVQVYGFGIPTPIKMHCSYQELDQGVLRNERANSA